MMMFYHGGTAIVASAVRAGNTYTPRVSILEEDGEATTLGLGGHFASRRAALDFAIRSATAFADGEPLPRPPIDVPSDA